MPELWEHVLWKAVGMRCAIPREKLQVQQCRIGGVGLPKPTGAQMPPHAPDARLRAVGLGSGCWAGF